MIECVSAAVTEYAGLHLIAAASEQLTHFVFDAPDRPPAFVVRIVSVDDPGDVIAGPVYGKEAALTAQIDTDDVVRGKFDLDVVGHYARPDVFALSVDTGARRPVVYRSAQALRVSFRRRSGTRF